MGVFRLLGIVISVPILIICCKWLLGCVIGIAHPKLAFDKLMNSYRNKVKPNITLADLHKGIIGLTFICLLLVILCVAIICLCVGVLA